MISLRPRLLSAIPVLVFLLGVTRAPAQNKKAAADVLFDQGKKLMAHSQFAEACPKFAESQRLDPAPGTLVWLADCYEKNGQTASAWSTYREALAAAKAAGQAQRESLAKERIAALEEQVSYLTIRVEDPSGGVQVKVNGQILGRALWGVPVPYDPGLLSVEASASERLPFSKKIEIKKNGTKQSLDIPRLAPLEAPPVVSGVLSAPPSPPAASASPLASSTGLVQPADAPPKRGALRTASYVLGGTGLVLGGVGLVLAFSGKSSAQSAIDRCREHTTCSQADLDDHERASRVNTAGLFLGGVGISALIGGAVLFFSSSESAATGARWLSPSVQRSFAGLSLGGGF